MTLTIRCRSLTLAIGGWLVGSCIAMGQSSTVGKFVPSGNSLAARAGHTATVLNDGRVLFAGGTSGVGPDAEIYDPTTGAFTATGNMITLRTGAAAVRLADGRVLLAGGLSSPSGSVLASAEMFDPRTGTFSAMGDMTVREWANISAVLLNDGRVLVSPNQIYDPKSGSFSPTNGTCNDAKAISIADGNVFMIGGRSACLYNPVSGTIQPLAFLNEPPVYFPTVTLLKSGVVLIAGGYGWAYGFEDTARTWLYDPGRGIIQKAAPLSQSRGSHSATLLLDGTVLIAGGYVDDVGTTLETVELYRPDTGTFATIGTMSQKRSNHTATLLPDGRVLIVGGFDGNRANSSAEIFVPAGYVPPPDCGKYRIIGSSCRRIDILPWYAAIPGVWETDLELTGGATPLRFDYSISAALFYDGIGHNLSLWDHIRGEFVAEGVNIELRSGETYIARMLAGVDCQVSTCVTVDSTGSLIVAIDGPDAVALDGARVRQTYLLFGPDGTVVGRTTVPAISRNEASSKWRTEIVETPRSLQNRSGAAITSFAVANLSFVQQAVIVRVFDPLGNLVASGKTPVLKGALSPGLPFDEEGWVGGVYASTLSGFLGVDLPFGFPLSLGGTDFGGTVTFEGEVGGKIAPVVIGGNWPAISALPAFPQ